MKKVLQIANLLNYRPSHTAKSLATGRNNIIGVAYYLNPSTPSRNLERTFFVNLLIERLNRMGYDVLSDAYLVPIINVDMIVEDDLFYQIYTDFPSLLQSAMKKLGTHESF